MKRGSSGLSLLVAVNKPKGLTSHDVVNRCRAIFGEKRVGHTGTLDPLATGVLPICIGPATRLASYLTAHDKSYRVTVGFGFETTTDDIEGEPTARGEVPPDLLDGEFAEGYVAGLVGMHEQVPPAYSAIKVNGKKAYDLARKGAEVELAPRKVEIYEASLASRSLDGQGRIRWVVDFSVSKGTYIRSLVRDLGRELGCPAHVAALERVRSGSLSIEECMSLETVEKLKSGAAVDPVAVLGHRLAYADDFASAVMNGAFLDPATLSLCTLNKEATGPNRLCCTSPTYPSDEAPVDGELVCVIVENKLKALYRFDEGKGRFVPDCVFATPVDRGF